MGLTYGGPHDVSKSALGHPNTNNVEFERATIKWPNDESYSRGTGYDYTHTRPYASQGMYPTYDMYPPSMYPSHMMYEP